MIFARLSLVVAAAGVAYAFVPVHMDGRKPAAPTFAADVAPILYRNCATCHHAGEVAPFSLTSYQDARSNARTIAAVVKQRYMPPWQAVSHGEFQNERTLTAKQIATIEAWAEAGAPAGDLKKAPPAPTYTPGWLMGPPDFVGAPTKAYSVPAEGADEFRCFVIPSHFTEDRFVTGVELRPGNHRIVHHVLVFLDGSGAARKREGIDGKPGYASFGGPGFPPIGSLGGWAPGLQPQLLGNGAGFLLPKGADIVLQVHYHKDGKPETDLTRIGLRFAKQPVDKQVRWQDVGEEVFSIPAGNSAYEVTATRKLPRAVTLLDMIPHMHWLGHDMTVTAKLPDGTVKPVIRVEKYDFNWQTRYTYREPIHLPAGTVLSLVAHYDNSATNPRNPNQPPKEVTFGEQTTNEMCYAFFSYTYDAEHIAKGVRMPTEDFASDEIDHIFDKFDANHDGYLDVAELTAAIKFFEGVTSSASGKGVDPEQAAKFVIAMYGKTVKGKITKAEFLKVAREQK